MNFQSWKVIVKGEEIEPSFAKLALQSKICHADEGDLNITEIETIDFDDTEKAELIATLMTKMVLNGKPNIFKFDENEKIWLDKWCQLDENGKEHKIDLARKIMAYYDAESGRNLGDNQKLDKRLPNNFICNE